MPVDVERLEMLASSLKGTMISLDNAIEAAREVPTLIAMIRERDQELVDTELTIAEFVANGAKVLEKVSAERDEARRESEAAAVVADRERQRAKVAERERDDLRTKLAMRDAYYEELRRDREMWRDKSERYGSAIDRMRAQISAMKEKSAASRHALVCARNELGRVGARLFRKRQDMRMLVNHIISYSDRDEP